MKRGWHKYIVYVSLIFLFVTLYKEEYLKQPVIVSPTLLGCSVILLFMGFILNIIAQKRMLQKSGYPITFAQALAMNGLNIFGKYVPGKMWMVMGKAVYLSEKRGYSSASLSYLFLHAQIIGLWCGLVLGIIGLFINNSLHMLSWLGLVFLAAFTVMMFSQHAHDWAESLTRKLLHRPLDFPILSVRSVFSLLPWFMGGWLLWGAAFFLFVAGLTVISPSPSLLFCFPLAGTFGILSLFAPGGMGVREGIMVFYMSLTYIGFSDAVTISAASRLWFLIGEIFIFLTGYLVHRQMTFASR